MSLTNALHTEVLGRTKALTAIPLVHKGVPPHSINPSHLGARCELGISRQTSVKHMHVVPRCMTLVAC